MHRINFRNTGSAKYLAVIGICLLFVRGAFSADCVPQTPGLESMELTAVAIEISPDNQASFDMLLADDNRERAAGFQHICPDVISATLILFIFPADYLASFHMRNVHAPLDIAFIDSSGTVVDIQTMNTYVLGARNNPLYSPPEPVRAALEADVGFFEQHGIKAGVSRILFPGAASPDD